MALMAMSTVLRELIKTILPGTRYATDICVQDELIPTLNSVASQIEGLHSDVTTDQASDHGTRVVLSVLVAILTIAIIVMGVWVRDTRKMVSRFSQRLTVVSSEMKIKPSESFPPIKY